MALSVRAQFNLNKYNGLPSNHVYMYLTDQYGYLWIATDNGVLRYNGYEFKLFNTSRELGSNDVWRLYKDRKNRIWLFSFSKSFGYIANNQYHKVIERNEVINPESHIHESEKGITFPSAVPLQLGKVDINKFILYQEIYKTTDSNSYMGTFLERSEDTLYLFQLKGKRLSQLKTCIFSPGILPPYTHGVRMLRYRQRLYVFTRKTDNLIEINLDSCSCRKVFNQANAPVSFSYIQRVESYEKKSNRSLYRFYKNQVEVLDTQFKVQDVISVQRLTRPGVSGYDLVYLFNDSTWGTCVATESNGGFISLPHQQSVFEPAKAWPPPGYVKLPNYKTTENYWWNEQTRTLMRKEQGRAVVAEKLADIPLVLGVVSGSTTNDKYLFVYDNYYHKSGNQVKKVDYLPINSNTPRLQYNYLFLASRTVFGVAKQGNGFYSKGILNGRFLELIYDSLRSGYWVYNPHVLYFINRYGVPFNMSSLLKRIGVVELQRFLADEKGNLYFLGDDRLFQYNSFARTTTELFTNYNLDGAKLLIHQHHLIVAGRFGITFQPFHKGGVPVIYHNSKNQYFQFVNDVQADDKDIIFQTDAGYFRVPIPTGHARTHNEIPDGELVLYYNDETYKSHETTVHIQQNNPTLQLDFIRPQGNGLLKYWYRITGNQQDWKEINGNTLVLPELKAGHGYIIELKMADAVWRSKPHYISIYLEPFWWQSYPGVLVIWVGGLFIMALGIYLTIYLTRKFIQRKETRQRQLIELELKAVYAQINPHFIFNTLNSALQFIKRRKNEDAYQHIQRFSQLLRAYLKASRNRYISLADEMMNLHHYIQLQQTRYGHVFTYDLQVSGVTNANFLEIPSLLLQPLVENAIEHGLMPLEEGGHLEILFVFDKDRKQLKCMISDNGIGRAASAVYKKRQHNPKESYGNNLIQELIGLFNKHENMGIELAYENIFPAGTRVIIVIKNPHLRYE